MVKEQRCLSQKGSVTGVAEQSKRNEKDKRLLHELASIVENADDHAQLIAMTNTGLSMVQAIQKILEKKHG